jgi:hypothetical protein
MAKAKTTSSSTKMVGSKTRRHGVHSKTKTSNTKTAKNYKKLNRGQG